MLRRQKVGIDTALILAEALRNDVAEIVIHGILRSTQDVGVVVGFGEDQEMFAPGAMAWAHRTSNEISSAQPTMLSSVGSKAVSPSGAIWVNVPRLGSAGRAKSVQARQAVKAIVED